MKLKTLGCDILDPTEKFEEFLEKIRKKKKNIEIGKILLDQKITCGCGNYIRADALYLAKISPLRKILDLDNKEIKKIWKALQKIAFFNYSVKLGLKNKIINSNDMVLLNRSVIYGLDEDYYKNKVIKQKLGDRTVHYVPNVQK